MPAETAPPPWAAPARARSVAASRCPSRGRVIAALAGIVLCLGLLLAGAGAAAAQADPSAGSTPTTASDLVVGSTTTSSPSAATTSTTSPRVSVGQARKRANADTRRVWSIVIALGAVALLLTILTVRYWFMTRPVRVPATSAAATGATAAVPAGATGSTEAKVVDEEANVPVGGRHAKGRHVKRS